MADLFVPDESALRLFLLGRLAAPDAERVERYLESHPEAASTLQGLAAEDTFTSALRGQPAAEDLPADVRAAMTRLERLVRPSDEQTTPLGSEADATRSAPGDPEDVTEDDLSFLSPARGPGELGWLGPYRVMRVLGAGGMGMVLDAEDPQLGRHVAIKVMRPRVATNAKAKERFLREARAAAKVEHDHIVPVYFVGEDNGVPYIVMPFLRGESLDVRLKREGRLPAGDVVRIGREAAEGLAAAHDLGLVHRDIKPANLWLEAPRGRVKVLDFGLARLNSEAGQLTQTGAIVGTPAYMAPEQARSQRVDARSDLFSLGAVLYRTATGQLPFRGSDTMSVLTSLAVDTPEHPRRLNPDLPPYLADLIVRLLDKDPAGRPQSARELIGQLAPPTADALPAGPERRPEFDLGAAGDTRVEVPQAGPVGPRAERKRGRGLTPVGIAVAALALIGFGLGTYKLVFETKDGTLVVEVDRDVELKFKDGELNILDAEGKKLYTLRPSERNKTLPPGEYQVRVDGPGGLALDTHEFKIERGGRRVVKVIAGPPDGNATRAAGGPDPDRRAAEVLKPHVARLIVRLPSGEQNAVGPGDPLPGEPFALTGLAIDGPVAEDFVPTTLLPAVADLRSFAEMSDPSFRLRWSEAELARLAETPAAATLHTLRTGFELTAKNVDALRRFPRLTRLACLATAAGDAELGRLRELPPLTELGLAWLGQSGRVGDAGWAAVAAPSIRHLDLTAAAVPVGLAQRIARMPDLESLTLAAALFDDEALPELVRCPRLRGLDLSRAAPTDAHLDVVSRIEGLRELNVRGGRVTEEGVRKLAAALPDCRIEWDDGVIEPADTDRRAAVSVLGTGGLVVVARADGPGVAVAKAGDLPPGPFQVLRATAVDADDPGLRTLHGLSRLTELTLSSSSRLTPAALAALAGSPAGRTIRRLALDGPGISDGHLEQVPGFPNLEELVLAHSTRVTGRGLRHLKKLRRLDRLSLDKLTLSDADLAELAGLDLTALNLMGNRVTTAGLERLRGLRRLADLNLHATGAGDAEAARIARVWPDVTAVTLSGPRLTDAGLAELARCRRLTVLRIDDTKVTDAGLDHLAGAPALTVLTVGGTKVTAAGVKKLAAALSGCKIEWDGGVIEPAGSGKK